MAIEIERRIKGLQSTLQPIPPFRASLKLVLDGVTRREKPGPLRFSYATSKCGLIPTNVNGRSRQYAVQKKICAFGRQKQDNILVKKTHDRLISQISPLKTRLNGCITIQNAAVTERDAI